jgi:hypothetical protein
VAADADQSPLGRTGDVERPTVKRENRVDHLFHRADVALAAARVGQGVAIERLRHVLIDHQALNGPRETRWIGRQILEQAGVAAGRTER